MEVKNNNVYFLGYRESDIGTTFEGHKQDDYFAGSITINGNGTYNNIAHNATTKKQINWLTESSEKYYPEFKEFFETHINNVLTKQPNAKLFPYDNFFVSCVPQNHQNKIICQNDLNLLSELNSKTKFKQMIDGIASQPKFEVIKGSEVIARVDKGRYPNQQVAVQSEFGSGGDGTFLLTKDYFSKHAKNEFKNSIIPNNDYAVSDFVENIGSASFHLLISENQIKTLPPAMQLMDGPSFIGCDFYEFSRKSKDIKNQFKEIGNNIGKMLQEKNYRGSCGIDVIIGKDNKVYTIEINPRMTGSSGLYNRMLIAAGHNSLYKMVEQCHNGKTNFPDFNNLPLHYQNRRAQVKNENGQLKLAESNTKKHFKEGFDLTEEREIGCYTYNVYDNRLLYKRILDKISNSIENSKLKKFSKSYKKIEQKAETIPVKFSYPIKSNG